MQHHITGIAAGTWLVAGLGLARLADANSIATALGAAAAIMVVTSSGLLAVAHARPQTS